MIERVAFESVAVVGCASSAAGRSWLVIVEFLLAAIC
jgi:hypothetical protein